MLYPISIILTVKNREKCLYRSGPILFNYFAYRRKDNPTREDVCNRFQSLLNLIEVSGIPSQDFSTASFGRAYKLSIKDVEDNHLVLKIQKMRDKDRVRDFNSSQSTKRRPISKKPQEFYPKPNEKQFERQESED